MAGSPFTAASTSDPDGPGDAHVEQDEVGPFIVDGGERLIAVGRLIDVEPLALEHEAHRLPHRRMVFDDQDASAHDARTRSANNLGPERLEVFEALPRTHETHGNAQLFADRQDDAALGRSVQLREHDPRHVHRLREGSGLGDPILTRRRVEHEQGLGDRGARLLDHPADLLELVHQRGLRVEASGRVHDEHVGASSDGRP